MVILKDHLTATRNTVTQAQFAASQDFTRAASWALWNTQDTSDITGLTPQTVDLKQLRSDIMIMGGNWGTLKNTALPPVFQNFHAPGHQGDTKLRVSVPLTEFAGAYMSDVVKNTPTPYATRNPKTGEPGILDLIKNDAVHMINCFSDPLQQEFDELGIPANGTIVLMGNSTVTVFKECFKRYGGLVREGLLDNITLAVVPYHPGHYGDLKRGVSNEYLPHLKATLEREWPSTGTVLEKVKAATMIAQDIRKENAKHPIQ